MPPKIAHNRIDIAGQKFGRLTVIEYLYTRNKKPYWRCVCDCGTEKTVQSQALRTGHTVSCGCKFVEVMVERNQTHGMTYTSEYNSWMAMRERCRNQNQKHYPRYGGRGIRVCAGWHDSFASFYADLGPKPGNRYSIDRVDNDKGYTCGHCDECKQNGWDPNVRWATDAEQASNRRKRVARLSQNK